MGKLNRKCWEPPAGPERRREIRIQSHVLPPPGLGVRPASGAFCTTSQPSPHRRGRNEAQEGSCVAHVIFGTCVASKERMQLPAWFILPQNDRNSKPDEPCAP